MFHAFNYMMGKQYKKLSDIERIKLSELECWVQVRDGSRRRLFSDEGRATISNKAKQRWTQWRETEQFNEICNNISKATKEGMKSINARIKTRVNLGCKKYWNPETGEQRNWYQGMPEFEFPWIRGRGPMSQQQREKLHQTQQRCQKTFYHNDELKINSTFDKDAEIPDGWVIGFCEAYRYNGKQYKWDKKISTLEQLKRQN